MSVSKLAIKKRCNHVHFMRFRALSNNLRRVSTDADYHRGALGSGQTINEIIGKLIWTRLCACIDEDGKLSIVVIWEITFLARIHVPAHDGKPISSMESETNDEYKLPLVLIAQALGKTTAAIANDLTIVVLRFKPIADPVALFVSQA